MLYVSSIAVHQAPLRAARLVQREQGGAMHVCTLRRALHVCAARKDDDNVQYGAGWYDATKRLSKRKSERETLGAWQERRERRSHLTRTHALQMSTGLLTPGCVWRK